MRPPSHAFQLRVIVSAIASAISTTSTGVPNRRQAVFSGLIAGVQSPGAAPRRSELWPFRASSVRLPPLEGKD